MHEPLIEIYDPEYYKDVFLHHELYTRMDTLYHSQQNFISSKLTSRGILYSEGLKWKQQRNILGVPFTYDKLKQRMPIVNEVVITQLDKWDGTKLNQFLIDLTSQIVMKSFFGAKALDFKLNGKSVPDEILDLDEVMAAQNLFNPYVVLKRLIFGRKGDKIFPSKAQKALNERVDQLMEFITSLIKEKNPNALGDDFLDIYLQAQQNQKSPPIQTLEICSMFVTMFAAGSGTSVRSLAMTLYLLGQEQEAQDEIRLELYETLNGENTVRDIHIPKLIKLSAFVQEMFRYKAPLFCPFIRKAKTTHYIKDLRIEKGTNILVLFEAPGWSDKHYENPNKFDYKRWFQQTPIKQDNGFVYIPFSAGGRNCIGQHMALMNMKIILSHILLRYKVTLDPNIKATFPINLFIEVSPESIIKFERIIY